jgi:pimeloyl-ACP methyl ester carboxylesterase
VAHQRESGDPRRLQSAEAGELFSALQAAGIARFALVGHALGALIGLQLALDTSANRAIPAACRALNSSPAIVAML